ncbi:hypothetical protein KK137_02285 [Croceibacterium sp. LX-88]|uniref:Uncharacterized protein n=1 Tax=Croceibacterium selenioxidans TaxID=2838833 RepID=A0ABS5W047_9SPHN|nr:hypothetical protein [Croceibacterium selenioxidans]MBT2133150.1 hypothetical protein [Croceibacterium selenioxidans]
MNKLALNLRLAGAAAALAASLVVPGAAFAQQAGADLTVMPPVSTDFQPKKTSWGDPDFRGTWPINDVAELPVNRPEQYGNRFFKTEEELAAEQARATELETRYAKEEKEETIGTGHWIEYLAGARRTSMVIDPVDGKLPAMTPQAEALHRAGRSSWTPNTSFDWVTDFDSWDRCISRGFPASMLPFRYNNGIRIYQAPGYVTIALEMLGTRVIPVRSADHWPEGVEAYLGNSVGHWEGNTLVIETTNLKSGDSATRDMFARNGSPLNMATRGVPPWNTIPTSQQAKVVERLTMTGENTITYEMTYSDAQVFTAPWTVRFDWTRDDSYEFFEYACHEGNVQVRNYITASRAGRLEAASADDLAAEGGGH